MTLYTNPEFIIPLAPAAGELLCGCETVAGSDLGSGANIATDAGPGHDLQPRGWGGYFMLPTGSQDNIWTCNVCLQIVQTSAIKQT